MSDEHETTQAHASREQPCNSSDGGAQVSRESQVDTVGEGLRVIPEHLELAGSSLDEIDEIDEIAAANKMDTVHAWALLDDAIQIVGGCGFGPIPDSARARAKDGRCA